MSISFKSRQRVRAVVGITIFTLSILPLFGDLIHLSDRKPLSPRGDSGDIKTVETINHSSVRFLEQTRQLLPRALPQRVTLSVSAAICQGQDILGQLTGPGNHKDANTAPKHLDGWTEGDPEEVHVSFEMASVLNALVPGFSGMATWADAAQDIEYHDIRNVEREPTDAYFRSLINAKDGFIIAVNNKSPSNMLKTAPRFQPLRNTLSQAELKEALPKQSFWSDIVWAQWKERCRLDVPPSDPAGLKYIIHDHITTENTQYIMEKVADPHAPHKYLEVDWPGIDFAIDSGQGIALLGTPHGIGAARMLIDHRQDIQKHIQKITVFTSGREYYLIFHIG